ncbi:MAG TPA: Gfo/Idh/MocA family oxidoreductase [Candidatus Hydrogenedentes bacterium]|nr:Gfo/Idh/MocA family oxidoreductase [Candidatus Hydrogenedentota bacterium]HOS02988.1 Gfo/Idh/MocA family oxidoreductase [Candidatus Hydrogenedentota bacterium]
MSRASITRRTFLFGATAAMTGCAALGGRRTSRRRIPPNERINIACIGVGGQGSSDLSAVASENIVALCDVDEARAAENFAKYAHVKLYKDFRVMLEKEKGIDAVTISTPDHMHAFIAMTAMQLGKHVYVQKPLTRTIGEARMLTEAARRYNVATQMGNQGHSGDGVRLLCEMIWSGMIGEVREVHAFTNRPIWPQGMGRPTGSDPVPSTLDWDLWLGVAPHRPFVAHNPVFPQKNCYCPDVWRGWWDFGAGALGDMGCHVLDPPYWALKLGSPTRVDLIQADPIKNEETGPRSCVLRYDFPAREGMGPVKLYWYDGGLKPPAVAGIPLEEKFGDGDSGSVFIGDAGVITTDTYGGTPRLLPLARMKDFQKPPQMLERISRGNHHQNWLQAIRGGAPACSNFDYSGPFTEMVLLGNLALRAGQSIEWDSKRMQVTNLSEANAFVKPVYRKGWSL